MSYRQVEQTTEATTAEHKQASPEKDNVIQRDTAVSTLAAMGGDPNTQANNLHQQTRGRLSHAGSTLLQLQNQYGNRYVQQLINPQQRLTVQPKLMLGDVDTPSEKEADRIANDVTSNKATSARPTPVSGTMTAVSPDIESTIKQAKGSGAPLSNSTRTSMEEAYGVDLGNVRVHTNSRADTLNQALRATAFTTGQDIFFRQGAYDPSSSSGQNLLAHELTHVVQQTAAPAMQRKSENDQHGPGCGCNTCSSTLQLKREQHTPSCGCAACSTVQLKPAADAHSAGCGCEACSSIQRLTVQPKLMMGSIDTPSEREADLIASRASRGEQLTSAPSQVNGTEIPVAPNVERAITQAKGGGQPLPERTRTQMEQSFRTDLSGVRVHTNNRADSLNKSLQAHAFTTGQDIFFRQGEYQPDSAAGQTLLAHELSHVMQQTQPDVAAGPILQRHSSHEHYLLGTVDPKNLGNIPFVRELIQNADGKKVEYKVTNPEKHEIDIINWKDWPAQHHRKIRNVYHTLMQEMDRLMTYYEKPEIEAKEIEEAELRTPEMGAELPKKGLNKGKWQVPFIRVPTKDGPIYATYGEVNTMPDFFGSLKALERTPKSSVLNILQGVRQRAYLNLLEWHQEIFTETTGNNKQKTLEDRTGGFGITGSDFVGAIGPRIGSKRDKKGPRFRGTLNPKRGVPYVPYTNMEMNKATTRENEKSDASLAALARNACHFAPESWITWRRYHKMARDFAKQSRKKAKQASRQKQNNQQKQNLEKERVELANKALLYNAFSDHYLQDSYAAGHLIDKTRIMSEFLKWLQENEKMSWVKDSKWAMILVMADQNLKSNPQALENIAELKKGDFTTEDVVAKVGLESKLYLKQFVWWRHHHPTESMTPDAFYDKIAADKGYGKINLLQHKNKLEESLDKMVSLKLVEKSNKGEYSIRKAQQNVLTGKGGTFKWGRKPQYKTNVKKNYKVDEATKEFLLQSYSKFLNSVMVQSVTSILHDKFCEEGLYLKTEGDYTLPGKVYGDNFMLAAGAQKNVTYQAQTTALSRDAILEIAYGNESRAEPIEDIEERFPKTVIVDNKDVSLANWNTNLIEECRAQNGVFQEASGGIKSRGVDKAKGYLAEQVLNIEELLANPGSKRLLPDEVDPLKLHGSDPF